MFSAERTRGQASKEEREEGRFCAFLRFLPQKARRRVSLVKQQGAPGFMHKAKIVLPRAGVHLSLLTVFATRKAAGISQASPERTPAASSTETTFAP
jgi:hypothetical protein